MRNDKVELASILRWDLYNAPNTMQCMGLTMSSFVCTMDKVAQGNLRYLVTNYLILPNKVKKGRKGNFVRTR